MRLEDEIAGALPPYPILVVHCQNLFCDFVQEILESEGYEDVRTAVWGRGALRMLRQIPHHTIVLLEPVVLWIIGNEGLRAYLTNPGQRAQHVVIAMAAFTNVEAYIREMHFDGFLQIPFSDDELVAVVEHAQRLALAKRNRTIH